MNKQAMSTQETRVRRKKARALAGRIPLLLLALTMIVPLLGLVKLIKHQQALWLLPLGILASLLAFWCYANDKQRATRGQWRISEKSLQLLALVGGWPGALAAQHRFRHKNKKASFQTVFWFIVLCHQLGWLDYLLFNGGLVAGLVQAGLAS